jgi:hypothetical protein
MLAAEAAEANFQKVQARQGQSIGEWGLAGGMKRHSKDELALAPATTSLPPSVSCQ